MQRQLAMLARLLPRGILLAAIGGALAGGLLGALVALIVLWLNDDPDYQHLRVTMPALAVLGVVGSELLLRRLPDLRDLRLPLGIGALLLGAVVGGGWSGIFAWVYGFAIGARIGLPVGLLLGAACLLVCAALLLRDHRVPDQRIHACCAVAGLLRAAPVAIWVLQQQTHWSPAWPL